MEYTIKLNEKAKMIISIDGPELYRGQKAENLASLENISELIKEVLKSRHNDITITEYAEKPSPELLAVIKERGECGKGRYENPELSLDIEWDYKVFKGSIGKYSYSDPFIKEGGLDAYLMLRKYAAVFTDYEDTMEYDGEKRIITKFFNGGHSVTYLAEDFRITAALGKVETVALREPVIIADFKADGLNGLAGMHFGRKTRFILPDETEIIVAGGKTSYVDGKDVLIPESLEDEREDKIMSKYPYKEWKDIRNRLEDAFESLENLKVPIVDNVREDLFKKIDRFKELAERYTIQGISDSFDTTVRNFEELINKNYGKGEEE
jgi:hypothetical protein